MSFQTKLFSYERKYEKSAKTKKAFFNPLTRSADFNFGCYDTCRHIPNFFKRFHSSDTTFNLTVSMGQCDKKPWKVKFSPFGKIR